MQGYIVSWEDEDGMCIEETVVDTMAEARALAVKWARKIRAGQSIRIGRGE